MKVAYVQGDDITPRLNEIFANSTVEHLDSKNLGVQLDEISKAFQWEKPEAKIVSAHAYLGSRAIAAALRAGADIVICGRVADASPVIGLATWWHDWSETDFDRLAGALIAGRKSTPWSPKESICPSTNQPRSH